MYKLPHFTEEDHAYVLEFMKQYPFAVITGKGDEFPVATQVPLDVTEEDGKLLFTGHIMKNTDHHKAFENNNHVLVVFNGPQCHVSASWYANPNVASTWNFMTVHAMGKILFEEEEGTRRIIKEITDKYELPGSEAAFDKLPIEYVDRLVKAIIGFKIEVETVGNVFKLSQNHDTNTRLSIIEHLKERGDDNSRTIATEMAKRIKA